MRWKVITQTPSDSTVSLSQKEYTDEVILRYFTIHKEGFGRYEVMIGFWRFQYIDHIGHVVRNRQVHCSTHQSYT